MLRNERDLKMHVQKLWYLISLQIGSLLRRLHNLTTTLMAYIFGIKHDINNRASALATRRSLLYRLKTRRTLVYKRLKIGPAFYPPYINSAFYFIARLRRQNSTKLSQTVDSKSR